MSETPILNAPVYEHGFVTGRYLTAVSDGPDADRLMDFTPAMGKVIFTPEMVIRRHEGPAPALVVQRPVTCELDEQGYLVSPGGGRGVALIAGIYTVKFEIQGAQVPGPSRIEVKASHTEVAPLDLVLAMPDVVPPGSVVVVDETTAQRAEAAAARAEAVVADIESEVRAVVLASPELKGEPGEPGKPGPPGRPGPPGPAPSIKIGTVTSGATPSATITGTSPDLTLGLVLPKGDRGDPGVANLPDTGWRRIATTIPGVSAVAGLDVRAIGKIVYARMQPVDAMNGLKLGAAQTKALVPNAFLPAKWMTPGRMTAPGYGDTGMDILMVMRDGMFWLTILTPNIGYVAWNASWVPPGDPHSILPPGDPA